MEKVNQPLKELAHTLDFDLSGLNVKIETLNDVNMELKTLKSKMDEVKSETVQFYFIEFHRKIRVISDLLSYIVNDLNNEFEDTFETSNAIFEKVVKGEGV